MPLTPEQVQATLRLGEDSRNEFKSVTRGLPNADDLAAAIVAFANAQGGRLWLGVDDDGSPSGVGDRRAADRLLQLIDNVCLQNVEPPLACFPEKVEHLGKVLVVVDVPAFAPGRPYRTQRGIYYIRGGASRRIASTEDVRGLVLSGAAGAHVPDEMPVPGTTPADLDATRFATYFAQVHKEVPPTDATAFDRLLLNLRIRRDDGLSLLGLLCFGKDPQRILPWARITAVRSPGTEVGLDLLDRKDFGGTLESQIAAAEEFVQRHLASPVAIRGFDPEQSTGMPTHHDLPLEAVREAVRNAVAHRDYAVKAQINITLYDDRLEVVSPGRLLNTVTVDAMKAGRAHVERNPLICATLAKRGLMTERGTGVRRMVVVMRERGLPDPEIEERGPSLLVTLRAKPLHL